MKRSSNNISPANSISSREVYQINKTRDFYRGTSFHMSGEWAPNTHYYNDEYVVDFVSYKGALLACLQSHLSTKAGADVPVLKVDGKGTITGIEESKYWDFVFAGTEGPMGKVWVPNISPEGNITWRQEGEPTQSVNLKGEKGEKGSTPVISVENKNGKLVWTSDGVEITDPITHQPLEARGPKGSPGENGKVYIPKNTLVDKKLIFTLSSYTKDNTIAIDLSSLRGERGQTPIFTLSQDGILSYFYADDRELRSLGSVRGPKGKKGDTGEKGEKGDKGDTGERGPVQDLKIEFDPDLGMSILYCKPEEALEWTELGPVGGMPGKSVKLIRIFGDPEREFESELADRILWGYDGVPVSEWTTLCYLDELKGDQNIEIGCPFNLQKYFEKYDQFGGPIDHYKIWYDICDDTIDKYSIDELLYQGYIHVGGILTKEDFEDVFSHLHFFGYWHEYE